MRQVGIIVAAALLAATVGACADPYYGYRSRTYAYTSDYNYPNYAYSSRPVYYSSAPVYYASRPAYYSERPYYGSRYDYYRNYNGIHSSAEVNAM
jgi:hypothetical protein